LVLFLCCSQCRQLLHIQHLEGEGVYLLLGCTLLVLHRLIKLAQQLIVISREVPAEDNSMTADDEYP
jgi:hypothetical protein